MHGHPHPQERDPGSEQDSRWQPLQAATSVSNSNREGSLPEQVCRENRQAQGISLQVVDNAIHFLKSFRLNVKGLLGKE